MSFISQFLQSGIQVWLTWVPCSASYKGAIKMLAGTFSCKGLNNQLPFHLAEFISWDHRIESPEILLASGLRPPSGEETPQFPTTWASPTYLFTLSNSQEQTLLLRVPELQDGQSFF